jgi:hypothetical protein
MRVTAPVTIVENVNGAVPSPRIGLAHVDWRTFAGRAIHQPDEVRGDLRRI